MVMHHKRWTAQLCADACLQNTIRLFSRRSECHWSCFMLDVNNAASHSPALGDSSAADVLDTDMQALDRELPKEVVWAAGRRTSGVQQQGLSLQDVMEMPPAERYESCLNAMESRFLASYRETVEADALVSLGQNPAKSRGM
eukprot:15433847-Alexandrium_andersonii.AAC.1